MKNLVGLMIALASSAILFSFSKPIESPPQDWTFDKVHSSITFSVRHLFTPVVGKFQSFQEDFTFDPEDLKHSKANLIIDVASINTEEAKRDAHLQSADFFDAGRFSQIKFSSTRFEKKSDGSYVAHGKLTIKEITKEISLPFTVLGVGDHPMMKGSKVMGIVAQTTINRNDFGVGTGNWAATMVVGDEINIQINLELVSKT